LVWVDIDVVDSVLLSGVVVQLSVGTRAVVGLLLEASGHAMDLVSLQTSAPVSA
jgi:hypothetical protein